MRTSKVLALVFGSLLAVVAFGLGAGGGALLWAHGTQRDAAGYYSTGTERFATPSYALTSERLDLGADVPDRQWVPLEDIGTARIRAASVAGTDVFIGIGRQADVDRYLAASAHDELTDVSFDPFLPTYLHRGGETAPTPPVDQTLWVASTSGPGRQTLTWPIESGKWAVVVMNADASRGVAVDASVGAKTGLLLPIGLGLLGAGLLCGAVAIALLVAGARRDRSSAPSSALGAGARPSDAVALASASSPGAYPLRVDAVLDEPLSRGLWLVKWLLVIPHLVVLAFLWIAFGVLTVVAGLSILFTGRYPRSIFDFNVGVLRWTWRVTFYAVNLGTDRYPPFSLAPDPTYPASLTVSYPESLSRSLVLVKWWLLAIPHYLVITIFGGGLTFWTWGSGDGGAGRVGLGFGLVGLMALVAGVVLLFRRQYPRSVFDFAMGMERWIYRVWAYAALMTDAYPPFRLDTGGADPAPPVRPSPGGPALDTPAAAAFPGSGR